MKKFVIGHWRLWALVLSLCAASLALRLTHGVLFVYSAGLIVAVPVAIAAFLYGGRAAFVTIVAQVLVNLGVPWASEPSSRVLVTDIAEAAVLSTLGIACGMAFRAKHRLTSALSTDALTGLANRQAFIHRIEQLITRGDAFTTVAILDLPDFSEVNDTFGYDIGDEVLLAIASRVAKMAGSGGLAAKDVGSRFSIVWAKQERPDEAIARDLLATVSEAVLVRGGSVRLQARVAVGRWNVTGGMRASDLMRATKAALDRAAHEGRTWLGAERLAAPDGASRLETLNALGAGITNGELRLHYQPIVALPSRAIRRFEGLVRWQHPTRGLLAPAEFIPLAEQSGLIVPLTEWVLGEAVRQSKEWTVAGLKARISINVGVKALGVAAGLPQLVERLTREGGVDPSALVIEVTESDAMSDPARSIAVLGSLKALGMRIEVDDFGTGYSSLSYLQKLPLDGVKIDRSFIRTLVTDTSTAAIVRAAIELSHALGLEAVAEGVEDEPSIARLAELGCDEAQGYFIARPMPADLIPGWIADHGGLDKRPDIEPMPARADGTRGTVLLVDDEHQVRLAVHRILAANGFRVIDAASASEALQVYSHHKDEIGLLLTDVFLSDWYGTDLAARLRKTTPGLPIVYMSGGARLHDTGNDPFLTKPFSKHQLVTEVGSAMTLAT